MSVKIKVVRRLLKIKKEADLKKSNKTNFKSIYDVLEINDNWRNSPQVIKNIALKELTVESTQIKNVPCFLFKPNFKYKHFANTPKTNEDILFVYIHGGGFVNGFAEQGAYLIKAISRRIGCSALAINYTLSPEETYPFALNQIVDVYLEIIKNHKPSKIIIGGESAGGNLCLALLLKLKSLNLELPKMAIIASGFLDLTGSGVSYVTNANTDVSLSGGQLSYMANAYLMGEKVKKMSVSELKNPLVSPIFGDFSNFPPIFFSVCSDEILYSDTLTAYQKCKACHVKTKLVTNKNCFHGYMALGDFFEEGKLVCNDAAKFIKSVFKLKTINLIPERKSSKKQNKEAKQQNTNE